MALYGGVDLGATAIRAVVGDADAEIRGRDRRPTPQGPTGVAVTEAVLDALRAAADDANAAATDMEAVGVGSFGPFDMAEGAIDDPANLPDSVDRIPLRGPISELIGRGRVFIHSDTSAGVIGERFHSERNPDHMAYLTISSGIGAGLCVDGRILSGWDGNAGEVGHWTVDPDGLMTCGCGQDGHWEAYASGENIPAYARTIAAERDLATDLPIDDPDALDAAAVFAADADGDPLATVVVDRVIEWNVIGVANLVNASAPLAVHVGGAVALNNEERIVDALRERVPDRVFVNTPHIRLTEFGDAVVVRGALASAITGGTGSRRER
jgi:glucokinase